MGLSSLVSKASSAVGGGAGAAQSPSKTSGNGAAAPSNEDKIPEGAAADDVEQLDDEPRNSASPSVPLSSCCRRGSGLPCPPGRGRRRCVTVSAALSERMGRLSGLSMDMDMDCGTMRESSAGVASDEEGIRRGRLDRRAEHADLSLAAAGCS